MRHKLLILGATLTVLMLVLAVAVRLRYGGGAHYPNLTSRATLSDSALETIVNFHQPIGNVAVSARGRLFFTVHPESRPSGAKLFEWRRTPPCPSPTNPCRPSSSRRRSGW